MTLGHSNPKQNNYTYLPQHASITQRCRPINGFEHYILEYIPQGDRKALHGVSKGTCIPGTKGHSGILVLYLQGEHDEIYV